MAKQPVKPPPLKKTSKPEEKDGGVQYVAVPCGTIDGCVLKVSTTLVSPVLSLGDALAAWEDAMLKGDYQLAAARAFDVAWLARECALRRGDEGNAALIGYSVDTE